MTLYIKFKVSLRCKMLVIEELKKLGLRYALVELGMVETMEDVSEKNVDN